jgi:hypothetical protein
MIVRISTSIARAQRIDVRECDSTADAIAWAQARYGVWARISARRINTPAQRIETDREIVTDPARMPSLWALALLSGIITATLVLFAQQA